MPINQVKTKGSHGKRKTGGSDYDKLGNSAKKKVVAERAKAKRLLLGSRQQAVTAVGPNGAPDMIQDDDGSSDGSTVDIGDDPIWTECPGPEAAGPKLRDYKATRRGREAVLYCLSNALALLKSKFSPDLPSPYIYNWRAMLQPIFHVLEDHPAFPKLVRIAANWRDQRVPIDGGNRTKEMLNRVGTELACAWLLVNEPYGSDEERLQIPVALLDHSEDFHTFISRFAAALDRLGHD